MDWLINCTIYKKKRSHHGRPFDAEHFIKFHKGQNKTKKKKKVWVSLISGSVKVA